MIDEMTTEELRLEYRKVKKLLGIGDEEVARMFGYANTASFRNAARKDRIMMGMVTITEMLTEKLQADGEDQ